jgi:hypothetical protein
VNNKRLRLRVGAGYSDRYAELTIPDPWTLTIHPQQGAPALTDSEIDNAFDTTVGCDPIRKNARGARTAVILVDDFRRPTPAEALCLRVIKELNAAGIRRENIAVVMGGGAHRTMTETEVATRLGAAKEAVGTIVSHDAFSSDVSYLGLTGAATPVLVNRVAAQADFSVSISTVYPHVLTAWGGGAKMVLPGIAHVSTSTYHHTRLAAGEWGGNPDESPARRDLEEAAELFGLDVSVCAVINADKALCGLRIGAPKPAHRSAIEVARRVYRTDMGGMKPDLVIANAYPMDGDPTQLSKADIPARRYGAPILIIADFADPCPWHGVYHGPMHSYLNRPRETVAERTNALLDAASVFLYTPRTDGFPPTSHKTWYCDDNWERLIGAMLTRFPTAEVCVLPTAPIQMPQ